MPSSETLGNLIAQNRSVAQALVSLIVQSICQDSWSNATFIGSGSIWFSDFLQVNGQLGIPFTDMYALESDAEYVRALYNNTNGVCVVRGGVPSAFRNGANWTQALPNYQPENRKFIWLNFDDPPNAANMEIADAAASQLVTSGDVLIVSFPSGFEDLEASADRYAQACLNLHRSQWRAEAAGLELDRFQLRPEAAYYTGRKDSWRETMAAVAWNAIKRRRMPNRQEFESDEMEYEDLKTIESRMPIPNRAVFEDWPAQAAIENQKFMQFATVETFSERMVRDRWNAAMTQYLETNGRASGLQSDLYAGALNAALLQSLKTRGARLNLETLINAVYDNGKETAMVGVLHKGANTESPQAVLQAIFGGQMPDPQTDGMARPLRTSVPAITPKESQALQSATASQIQQWMKDILENDREAYPYLPSLIRFYPKSSETPPPAPPTADQQYYVLKNPDGILMTVYGQPFNGSGYSYPFGPNSFAACSDWINSQTSSNQGMKS
jgi:hypothetical protein